MTDSRRLTRKTYFKTKTPTKPSGPMLSSLEILKNLLDPGPFGKRTPYSQRVWLLTTSQKRHVQSRLRLPAGASGG